MKYDIKIFICKRLLILYIYVNDFNNNKTYIKIKY